MTAAARAYPIPFSGRGRMIKVLYCIKCEGQQLLPKMIEDVEIDYCARCGGMWLDSGEVRQLSRSESAVEEVRKLEQRKGTEPTPADQQRALETPCPSCGGKLTLVTFGPTNVERCTSCRGVFLDRGELEKTMRVIGSSSEMTTTIAIARSVVTVGTIGEE